LKLTFVRYVRNTTLRRGQRICRKVAIHRIGK
jgi:hypothetical protein